MMDNETEIADILADAAKPDVDCNSILLRVSQLGQRLGGDARHSLQSRVYTLLENRR